MDYYKLYKKYKYKYKNQIAGASWEDGLDHESIEWVHTTAQRIHEGLGETLDNATNMALTYLNNEEALQEARDRVVVQGVVNEDQVDQDGYVDVPYINGLGETLTHRVRACCGDRGCVECGQDDPPPPAAAPPRRNRPVSYGSDSDSSSEDDDDDDDDDDE